MLSAVLKVFKDIVNNIASERLIKELWIESYDFIGKMTANKFIDWHLEVFIQFEGALRPGLSYK